MSGVLGKDGKKYYGTSEIASACGVTRQAVRNWVVREKMPSPYASLRMGPVWRETVELREFILSKGGKP